MNIARIESLKQILTEEPNDAFTLYALGLEYIEDVPSTAWAYFQMLLTQHPDYVGTYFHAGKCLYKLGKYEDALRILEKGMGVAQKLQDSHAFKELKNVHYNLTLGLDWE